MNGKWSEWLRSEYRVFLLFVVFLLLLGAYLFRRIHFPGDESQTAFLNNLTDLVLGALIGILSERWKNGRER